MKHPMRYSCPSVLFGFLLLTALTCGMRAVERTITLRGTVVGMESNLVAASLGSPFTLTVKYDTANEPGDSAPGDDAFVRFGNPWLAHTLTVAGVSVSLTSPNAVGFNLFTGSSREPQDIMDCMLSQRNPDDAILDGAWNVVAPFGHIFSAGNTNLMNAG